MDKSPEAFRTISEVAEALETPAHVLRFWESRFPQIKPVKRAGGRRYYRPADVALLGGIRHLLHDEGMTIRGVQKILREQGVRHVAAMAAGSEEIDFDADLLDGDTEDFVMAVSEAEADTSQVVALEPVKRLSPPQSTPAEVVQLRAVPEPSGPKLTTVPEEVPEAGHIWVEDEPEMDLGSPIPLFAERPELAETDPTLPPLPTSPPGFAPNWPAEPGSFQSGQPDDLSGGFVVSGASQSSRSSEGIAMTSGGQRPAAGAQMVLSEFTPRPADATDSLPDEPTEAVEGQFGVDADAFGEAEVVHLAPETVVDTAPVQAAFMDSAPSVLSPALSGIAGRIRALPRPIFADHADALTELHSRLGLLLAQMAEAQHQKR